MRPLRVFAAVVTLATACGGSKDGGSSASFTYIDSEGGGRVEIDAVVFEIDPSVRYRLRYESSSPGKSHTSTTVDGHEFGLRAGRVFVGDRDYGPAPPGAHVVLTRDGVSIDGESRGPLPPAKGD